MYFGIRIWSYLNSAGHYLGEDETETSFSFLLSQVRHLIACDNVTISLSLSLSTAMKRKRESLEETLENLPDGWESYMNVLKDLDEDQQAVAIAHLCQQLGVTENQVKKGLQSLPSFSSEKWAKVAPQLGFLPNVKDLRLECFAPPMCLLPPSDAAVRVGEVPAKFLRTENRILGSVQDICWTWNWTIGSVQVQASKKLEPNP